jgi:amino acid adenylation domain-containing protein
MDKNRSLRNSTGLSSKKLVKDHHQLQVAFSEHTTLASIFYEQAAKYRDQIALSFKGEKVTYDELNRRSNQVAHLLCQIGIQPGQVVMVLMERSTEAYIAILGILKAGAAYLPVDPATPPERVHFMLTQSGVQAVLTRCRFLSLTEDGGAHYRVTLDELKPFQKAKRRSGKVFEKEDIDICPDVDLPLRNSETDLAYIIYTSGSTGTPKGVMIEQRSVINLVSWSKKTFDLTNRSCIAQGYAIAFDASVQEIFSAWASGATLYPIPEDIQVNPPLFVSWLRENAISYWDTIPSLWYQIVHFIASQSEEKRIVFPQLEVLVLGGEVLRADKIHEWASFVNHAHRIYNVYGPTEATVTTTYYLISPDEKRHSIAIGQPVDNAEVSILDEHLHQCMPGTEGEIWIGGMGLARGYLHAEELTRSSFLSIELAGKGKQRLYRTGDFGRFLPDGNLEFAGRRDEQVKVRGYRIELAEIEAALRSCPGVEDAVVLVKDEVESRKIIAYFTERNEELSVHELRDDLQTKIPHYMLPHYFIRLTAMPLTANNKIDKATLLQFAGDRSLMQDDVYQEPTTSTEKLLARIWKEILRLEKISVHDNFFALGGDSILSIMIRNRCELEGIRLKTVDLFQRSTIKTLARYIDDHAHELQLNAVSSPSQHPSTIVLSPEQKKCLPPEVSAVLPLLPSQYGMLYESTQHTQAISVPQRIYRCEGTIDLHAFEKAINILVQRHEAFRILFRRDIASQPVQIILSHANYQLPWKDLSAQAWQEQEASIAREARTEREQSFDVEQWPLFRFTVYKRSETRFDILWTVHHLIIDGWSISLCLKELSHVYSNLAAEKFRPLPQPRRNFSDYITHFLSKDDNSGKEFWERYLADMQPLKLPEDPFLEKKRGRIEEISIALDKESSARLIERARQNKTTLNIAFLAAYFLLLKNICQQDDLSIGVATSARSEDVEEGMSVVGNLTNTHPLRVNTHGATTVEEMIDLVTKSLLTIQLSEFPGLADIPPLITREGNRSFLQALFVCENDPNRAERASFHTFTVTAIVRNERNSFPLTVVCYTNDEEGLAFTFAYMADLFRRDTIETLARRYLRICEGLA